MNHPAGKSPSEGYVKFECHQEQAPSGIPAETLAELNRWRKELWDRRLVGVNPDGIGYGNISVRLPGSDLFYISGTSTGGIPDLEEQHYPLVERCDIPANTVWCRGVVKASAESMSHAAVYLADPAIGAVVHIHSRTLWDRYRFILPTTDPEAEYGTPDMAAAIHGIMVLPATRQGRIFVMGGHEEGLISFGSTLEEAARLVLDLSSKIHLSPL